MRVLVGILAAGLAGCAQHSVSTMSDSVDSTNKIRVGYEQTEAIRFSPDDWPQDLYGDLYIPDYEGLKPAVLLVHGGGWEARSRQDMNAQARRAARQGFVVLNIDYRFAPEFPFPASLHDTQIAMHWLHDQADTLRIDPTRISAIGFSSGAHLVSLMANVAGQGGELDRPYGGLTTRPHGVIIGGAPLDLLKFSGGRLVEQYLGGTPLDIPEQYALASPQWHLHDNAPPHFLYHGRNDNLVPVEHSLDYAAALASRNIEHEVYLMRWRGHATAFITAQRAIDKGLAFLRRIP
ncbi:alpha/beta fold hydrolase [Salinispirillum marinum]|uniref:Alpha/beta fold hydrolase n=2 Tax=Saccharospirillaceae TaxID=255527 RepID=A0ABV8BGZ7_9GAMM